MINMAMWTLMKALCLCFGTWVKRASKYSYIHGLVAMEAQSLLLTQDVLDEGKQLKAIMQGACAAKHVQHSVKNRWIRAGTAHFGAIQSWHWGEQELYIHSGRANGATDRYQCMVGRFMWPIAYSAILHAMITVFMLIIQTRLTAV